MPMRKYELVLIARPSLKDAETKKLLETVKGWLKDFKFTKEDDMGQKALAYTIKKEVAGHFFMFQIEADQKDDRTGGIPRDFEERVIRQDNIIRHLMLRTK